MLFPVAFSTNENDNPTLLHGGDILPSDGGRLLPTTAEIGEL
jgi:hypothetical protein